MVWRGQFDLVPEVIGGVQAALAVAACMKISRANDLVFQLVSAARASTGRPARGHLVAPGRPRGFSGIGFAIHDGQVLARGPGSPWTPRRAAATAADRSCFFHGKFP
jgi:hypothetical protein